MHLREERPVVVRLHLDHELGGLGVRLPALAAPDEVDVPEAAGADGGSTAAPLRQSVVAQLERAGQHRVGDQAAVVVSSVLAADPVQHVRADGGVVHVASRHTAAKVRVVVVGILNEFSIKTQYIECICRTSPVYVDEVEISVEDVHIETVLGLGEDYVGGGVHIPS